MKRKLIVLLSTFASVLVVIFVILTIIKIKADRIPNDQVINQNSQCTKNTVSGINPSDFIIGVQVSPRNFYWSQNEDINYIKKIANTVFVDIGGEAYWDDYTLPYIRTLQSQGLKIILLSGHEDLIDNPTALTVEFSKEAAKFAGTSGISGWRVVDEIGENTDPAYVDKWLTYLRIANQSIKQYSNIPIYADVIPWELWRSGVSLVASNNAAIDRYTDSGYIDGLLISCGLNYTGGVASVCLPAAKSRWGNIKIFQRTSARMIGTNYASSVKDVGNDPGVASCKIWNAYNAGTNGIHFWMWRGSRNNTYFQMLDSPDTNVGSGGVINPLYAALADSFSLFQSKISGNPPTEPTVTPEETATDLDSVPTSASIKPPTELIAQDIPNDQGNNIKLSWKKSASSSIIGYRLYRSLDDKKYTRFTVLKSSELEFIDSVAETEKTYYYIMRSYNASVESKNSNKASAASVNNLTATLPPAENTPAIKEVEITDIPAVKAESNIYLTPYNIAGVATVLMLIAIEICLVLIRKRVDSQIHFQYS